MEITLGQTVEVRGMTGTVLRISGTQILVEAQRTNGAFVNIWVTLDEIKARQ